MDLKKLEYLESIYRLQSFSKAANEHYISQPSISNAIRRLEEELGVTLVDRDSKPLTLTLDGIRFMPHVYKILGAVTSAEAEIREIAIKSKGRIQLLVHSTLGDWTLSQMAYDFHLAHPQYYVFMGENTVEGTLYSLMHEKVDAAYTLIPSSLDMGAFDAFPILNCKLAVLMSNQHPLAQKETVSFEDIREEMILTFPDGSQLLTTLSQWFRQHDCEPKILTPGSIHIISELVERNCGIFFTTVDPLSTLKNSPSFQVRPLQDEFRYSKSFIVKKGKAARKPLSTLISFVEEVVHEKLKEQNLTGPIFISD